MTTMTAERYVAPAIDHEFSQNPLVGLQIVTMRMQTAIDRNNALSPIELGQEQAAMLDRIAERPLRHAISLRDEAAYQLNSERVRLLDQLMAYPELFDERLADNIGMADGQPHGSKATEFYIFIDGWNPAFRTYNGGAAAVVAANIMKDLVYAGSVLSHKAKQARPTPPVVPPTERPRSIPVGVGMVGRSWELARIQNDTENPLPPINPSAMVAAVSSAIGRLKDRVMVRNTPVVAESVPVIEQKLNLSSEELINLQKLWDLHVSLPVRKLRSVGGKTVTAETMQRDLRAFSLEVQVEADNINRRCLELGISHSAVKSMVDMKNPATRLAWYHIRDSLKEPTEA